MPQGSNPSVIDSLLIYEPLSEACPQLASRGYRVVSLPEYVSFLVHAGVRGQQTLDANFVREGVVYFSGSSDPPRLVRESPILSAVKTATRRHMEKKEFHPDADAVERAVADSIEFPGETVCVPANRVGEDELCIWTYGGGDHRLATSFGNYLLQHGIESLVIRTIEWDVVSAGAASGPFARQVWVAGPDGGFCLYPGRIADYDIPVRGVRERGG